MMNTNPQWPSDSFCNKTFERSLPWTTSKNDQKYFYFCLYQKWYEMEKPESFCDFKIHYYESQNFTNIPLREKLIFVGCIEKKLVSIGLHREIQSIPPDIFTTNMTYDTINISTVMPLIILHVFKYEIASELQNEKIMDYVRKNGGYLAFPKLFEDFTEEEMHFLSSFYYIDPQVLMKLSYS